MRRPALAVLALLVLAGCSNEPEPDAAPQQQAAVSSSAAAPTTQAPQPFSMIGSISLSESFEAGEAGVGCLGTGGFDDIAPGTEVTVYDASTTIVGVGSITVGAPSGTECLLFFEVTDVPPSAFYQVEVSGRGLVTFTDEQARGGEVMLSLG